MVCSGLSTVEAAGGPHRLRAERAAWRRRQHCSGGGAADSTTGEVQVQDRGTAPCCLRHFARIRDNVSMDGERIAALEE